MKLPAWIAVSFGIHAAVIAAVMFFPKISLPDNRDSAPFVQLAEDIPSPVRKPRTAPLPTRPRFDPEGEATNKLPVTNVFTNEALPESDTPSTNTEEAFDPATYSPFYMVDEAPAALTPIEPAYPEEMRRLGVEGRVVLKLFIDDKGRLRGLEVGESPGEAFSRAAKEAVEKAVFRPAYSSGRPKSAWVRLALRFRLE